MVLRGEGIHCPVSLSIVFCDDAKIGELNHRYLNHDYPTDVLSFPMDNWGDPSREGVEFPHLGDILISVERAADNARRYRQTLERELLRLVIHGALHLIGYDDSTPQGRRRMRRKEDAYLRTLEKLSSLMNQSR